MRNNSSKTGLFLMELIIAILFFSLAGAICVQLFIQSHIISNKSVTLNHSVLWVQNVAETFYGCNGNVDQMAALLGNCIAGEDDDGQWIFIYFDKEFNQIESAELVKNFDPSSVYILHASITRISDLAVCNITMKNAEDTNETEIYSLSVSLFPDEEVSDE